MNYKSNLINGILVFSVAAICGFSIYTNNTADSQQQAVAINQHKSAVENKSTPKIAISNGSVTEPITKNTHENSASTGDIKISAEPTLENADMQATGEFADQVNFSAKKIECSDTCADDSTVNTKATGEFADQINADDILIAAKEKGFAITNDEKLMDVTESSHPPTELGVYTPPANN